ncbi:MAG: hypothetical protein H7834_13450 [Magnetococcus sp. YQC-9]
MNRGVRWISRSKADGFSLISLALLLMVLGVGLSTLTLLWPNLESVGREKSIAALRADRNALLGFVAAWAQLPDATGIASLLPRPVDGFLNPIQYAHDARLTQPQAVCQLITTHLTVEERGNVALALWSHGRNGRVNLSNGQPDKRSGAIEQPTRFANPPFDARGTPDEITDDLDDLLEFVTLETLQAVAGCQDPESADGLAVVVDRLPIGFEEQTYGTVTFTARGGQPPYRWCVESTALMPGGALTGKITLAHEGVVQAAAGCAATRFVEGEADATLRLQGVAPFAPGDGSATGRRHGLRVWLEDGTGQRAERLFELQILSLEEPGAIRLLNTPRLSKPPTP